MSIVITHELVSSLWETEFKKQFSKLPDSWQLTCGSLPSKSIGWRQFRGIGQVQFRCKKCGHTWATMRGIAIFHYQLRTRKIRMELMGQKCNRCADHLGYQSPIWNEEEVSYTVANVKEKCYGIKSHNKVKGSCHRHVKKQTKGGPHLSRLCQACERGVCEENQKDVAVDINDSRSHLYTDGQDEHQAESDCQPVDSDHPNCGVASFICISIFLICGGYLCGFNPLRVLYTIIGIFLTN